MSSPEEPGILIFGGTFDPPHVAHVILPPLAAEQLRCERIIYVPAALNPLKLDSPPTADHHRLAMLKLAIGRVPKAEVSTIELDRPEPSYMVETLTQLRAELDAARLHLLIGADQAVEFHRWRHWQRIIELATPAVMIRPPWHRESFEQTLKQRYSSAEAQQWLDWTLQLPRIDATATEIRRRLACGEPVDQLLAPDVLQYITEHRLYGVNGA